MAQSSTPRLAASITLALTATSCVLLPDPIIISQAVGRSGWYVVRTAPASTDLPEDPRPYRDRFTPVPLGLSSPPCEQLRALVSRPGRPILVAVPGIGGDNEEWRQIVPRLDVGGPAAVFMYRWVPFDARDPLVEGLAAGIGRIIECAGPGAGPVIVLAHSAGGVIASFAAARIAVSSTAPDQRVVILTVAAPLAGTVDRAGNADGTSEAKFILDLGTAITAYPEPARGVSAAHLCTSWPADPVMKPDSQGHRPNEPGVGVPGARVVDLPVALGHSQALLYVADQLVGVGLDSRVLLDRSTPVDESQDSRDR